MPIYEFKCMNCNELNELLVINNDEEKIMGCPKCKSKDFERVISVANHWMGTGSSQKSTGNIQNRTCSSGSCVTYDIPGQTN